MYEDFYGFTEKPFSLTPDPKYLYKSETHANAFDLLQYAIRRREGFVVVTGDIGTGKTTVCRAILEQLGRETFTALILNPFITEEDLLRLVLQDFGVLSRAEVKRGRLAGVSKQALIDTLNDFLLSLQPLGARALVIIDEAQNLPPQVLEQIRILSNLETDKEKLLQIVLVGQLNLQAVLRAPGMRQFDQRVSIRYQLNPLSRDDVAAYVAHRLAIAGGNGRVAFTPRALDLVHRYTGGIPRLINLLCDRALLGCYSERKRRVSPDHVRRAAMTLELAPAPQAWLCWLRRRAVFVATGVPLAAVTATAVTMVLRSGYTIPFRSDARVERAAMLSLPSPASPRQSFSILVGAFANESEADASAARLQQLGFSSYRAPIDSGDGSRALQLFVGQYDDVERARQDESRLRRVSGFGGARIVLK